MFNLATLTIALIFSILGFGVFLSFKILNITDLTIEASYTLGGAICILFCKNQLPIVGLLIAFIGGCLAGMITALLYTKLKINAILSGILTLTAFYSVNLIVTGRKTTIGLLNIENATIFYNQSNLIKAIIMILAVIALSIAIVFFFKTKTGLSLRAVGDNNQMAKSVCISTDNMIILGLMLSNGLVALAGAFFVEFQGSYSSDLGRGIMVVGVATIIIGELFTFKKHNISIMLVGIIIGSIIYRLIYSVALSIDFIEASDLKLISSLLLIAILAFSTIKDNISRKKALERM